MMGPCFRRTALGVFVAAFALGGCADESKRMHFLAASSNEQEFGGETFTIRDRPEESQMLLVPGFRTYVQAAFDSARPGGVTYEPRFDDAALAFLRKTGRDCVIASHRDLSVSQWEVTYKCK